MFPALRANQARNPSAACTIKQQTISLRLQQQQHPSTVQNDIATITAPERAQWHQGLHQASMRRLPRRHFAGSHRWSPDATGDAIDGNLEDPFGADKFHCERIIERILVW